jgi:hypothetical protein
MDNNIKANVSDQAVKGAVIGALAYLAGKAGFGSEVVALFTPVALAGMAWLSTKIGDKTTTAIFSVVTAVAEEHSKKKKK